MENSLLEVVQKISGDVPFCLVWLEKDGIMFESGFDNVNDVLEMLYLMCKSDVVVDSICETLDEKDAKFLKDAVTSIKGYDSEDGLDDFPLVKPISMARPQ